MFPLRNEAGFRRCWSNGIQLATHNLRPEASDRCHDQSPRAGSPGPGDPAVSGGMWLGLGPYMMEGPRNSHSRLNFRMSPLTSIVPSDRSKKRGVPWCANQRWSIDQRWCETQQARRWPGTSLYGQPPQRTEYLLVAWIVESILGSMSITLTAHEHPNFITKWLYIGRGARCTRILARATCNRPPLFLSAIPRIPIINGDARAWLKVGTVKG